MSAEALLARFDRFCEDHPGGPGTDMDAWREMADMCEEYATLTKCGEVDFQKNPPELRLHVGITGFAFSVVAMVPGELRRILDRIDGEPAPT